MDTSECLEAAPSGCLFEMDPCDQEQLPKSKGLPSPAGPFYLQWNSEMGKPEFFTTLICMDVGSLKTPAKLKVQTCLEINPEASEKLLLLNWASW